ncbi:MAG: hypothetical protein GY874_02965 [Desulfobacteraceae bacterium]|nr:hypothetical protein [Desulfobacteraceae bacterium]
MTRREKGHFAAKHPQGAKPDPLIENALKSGRMTGTTSCAAAHEVANTLAVSPLMVGKTIDLMEGRIIKCQLGLFGYTQGKKVQPKTDVSADLKKAITRALSDGRLRCSDAWNIADELGLTRLGLANACESLKIRITQCQLGAF